MEKFEKIEKKYDAWKCKSCGKDDLIATIKHPTGNIIVCLDCLAIEREPQPAESPKAP